MSKCSDAHKLQKRTKRQKIKAIGLCVRCGWRSATIGKTLCGSCRKKRTIARRKLAAQGRCYWCPKPVSDGYKTCNTCRLAIRQQRNAFTQARKDRVITHYSKGSMACACCCISIRKFLTLDHIDGNGNKHRKQIGTGSDCIYRWVEKNNYPNGFQVLCFNCNSGRALNGGICPHKQA
jgi:hypothetical protein